MEPDLERATLQNTSALRICFWETQNLPMFKSVFDPVVTV
jgi:hypothetical protein